MWLVICLLLSVVLARSYCFASGGFAKMAPTSLGRSVPAGECLHQVFLVRASVLLVPGRCFEPIVCEQVKIGRVGGAGSI